MLSRDNDDFFKSYSAIDPILNWVFDRNDSISGANYKMADAYYECSVFLINECLNNGGDKKGDTWIFPIMFCANQCIELYLKGILTQIQQISLSKSSDWDMAVSDGEHSIDKLAQKLYEYQCDNSNYKLAPLDKLQIVVDFTEMIFQQDEFDTTFARYPTAKNKDKHTKKVKPNKLQFYNAKDENCGLNLRLYLRWVEEVYNILDGVASNLCAQIEAQNDRYE